MRIIAAVAALLAGASAASAQPLPPDPATITLPDMTPTRDRRVIEEGWKYFYFHKAGASYAEAYADFAECYRFLPMATGMLPSLPMFVPWRETPGVRHVDTYNPYGWSVPPSSPLCPVRLSAAATRPVCAAAWSHAAMSAIHSRSGFGSS